MPMDDVSSTGLEIAHHARWLRRLALGILRGDAAAAEDVVQETWLAAVSRPPGRS